MVDGRWYMLYGNWSIAN